MPTEVSPNEPNECASVSYPAPMLVSSYLLPCYYTSTSTYPLRSVGSSPRVQDTTTSQEVDPAITVTPAIPAERVGGVQAEQEMQETEPFSPVNIEESSYVKLCQCQKGHIEE